MRVGALLLLAILAIARAQPVVNNNVNQAQIQNNNAQSTVVQQATKVGIVATNTADGEGAAPKLDVKKDETITKSTTQTASTGAITAAGDGNNQAAVIGPQTLGGPQTQAVAIDNTIIQPVTPPPPAQCTAADECSTARPCRPGQTCSLDCKCVLSAICPADQFTCGTNCCKANEDCVQGQCLPQCQAGLVRCGTRCVECCTDTDCGANEECVSGTCRPKTPPFCTAEDECSRDRACPAGQFCDIDCECQREAICPEDQFTCGTNCCNTNQDCILGQCLAKCPPGSVRCGLECTPFFENSCCTDQDCQQDEECVDFRCLPECDEGLQRCNDNCVECCTAANCAANEDCVNGECTCLNESCGEGGELCCAPSQACNAEGQCEDCPTDLCDGVCCGDNQECVEGQCTTDDADACLTVNDRTGDPFFCACTSNGEGAKTVCKNFNAACPNDNTPLCECGGGRAWCLVSDAETNIDKKSGCCDATTNTFRLGGVTYTCDAATCLNFP